MVTVKAEDMAQQISSAGSVSLYGIYFDFNKADIKPESRSVLDEIARLLKTRAGLKLLVAGTPTMPVALLSIWTYLSAGQPRWRTRWLPGNRIDQGRLSAVGVSFASPVASNKTEEGRARNRRVQLVEN
jgi:outer membrane protein OmpA-like peptidoglycan-associated protein